jgi:hypothetical protein
MELCEQLPGRDTLNEDRAVVEAIIWAQVDVGQGD